MERLDEIEAFSAMKLYLEKYYALLGSDDLGLMLSGMRLLPGGGTADPAAWDDWMECVRRAKQGHGAAAAE